MATGALACDTICDLRQWLLSMAAVPSKLVRLPKRTEPPPSNEKVVLAKSLWKDAAHSRPSLVAAADGSSQTWSCSTESVSSSRLFVMTFAPAAIPCSYEQLNPICSQQLVSMIARVVGTDMAAAIDCGMGLRDR